MKIYLLQEIHFDVEIDWFNTYAYKKKETAIEHVANEVNEPLEDIQDWFKDHNEYTHRNYTYRIEETELE